MSNSNSIFYGDPRYYSVNNNESNCNTTIQTSNTSEFSTNDWIITYNPDNGTTAINEWYYTYTHIPINGIPITFTFTGWGGGGNAVIKEEEDDLAVPVEAPKPKAAGCTCVKCKDFNEYAEVNQEDGTFKCYRCRNSF